GLLDLASLAKIGALGRAAATGLFKRYPLFVALMALSLSRSLVASTGHRHPYREFWLVTSWPMAIFTFLAAIEAFWILAGHFRRIRNFAWGLISIILAVS